MNNLPEDPLLHILSLLPGEDVSLFTRISKTFGNFIKIHRHRFPKPLISVSFKQRLENPQEGVFTIQTSKHSYEMNTNINFNDFIFTNATFQSTKLITSFSECSQNTRFHDLLKWLLSVCDVNTMYLKWVTISLGDWIAESLKNGRCKCFHVEVYSETSNLKFMTEIGLRQKEIGVPVDLFVDRPEMDFGALTSRQIDAYNDLSDAYSIVVDGNSRIWLFSNMRPFLVKWRKGLKRVNFKILIDFSNPGDPSFYAYCEARVDSFLWSGIRLLNCSREEMIRFIHDEGFDLLPAYLDMEWDERPEEILRFHFEKTAPYVYMSVEVIQKNG